MAVQGKVQSIYSINGGLVALVEAAGEGMEEPVVRNVPGGGRVLVAGSTVLAAVAELLGPSARATNPYEEKRRKEFMRRVVGHSSYLFLQPLPAGD